MKIRNGIEWVPARGRIPRAVSARLPSRDGSVEFRGAWANRSVVGSTDPRSRKVNATGRTLAECCELQQVPMAPLDGFTKSAAYALVGNAVPPVMAEHVIRTVLQYDREAAA